MIKYYSTQSVEENICTFELGANGHAGFDEYGRDIVCAAATILIVTLANRLNDINAKALDVQLIPGNLRVSCQAHVSDFRIRDAFEFAELGLDLVSTEHPENIEKDNTKKG